MTWPMWLREKVRDFVGLAAAGPWPQMRDQARRLLDEIPEEPITLPGGRRARVPARARARTGVDKSALPFAPVAPGRPKEDRDAARAARMRRIWVAVHARAGKRCEWCRHGECVQIHHTLGGSERRELEDETTCCGLCSDCHAKTEESPIWDLEQSLRWARRLGFAATVMILEGKLALARAQGYRASRAPVAQETTR